MIGRHPKLVLRLLAPLLCVILGLAQLTTTTKLVLRLLAPLLCVILGLAQLTTTTKLVLCTSSFVSF
jgi:hypothetical protein